MVAANPELVEKVSENPNAINALLGQVMRQSKGQAKPDVVRRLLEANGRGYWDVDAATLEKLREISRSLEDQMEGVA